MFPPKYFLFPEYHRSISFLANEGFLMAPVGVDDLAVRDDVRGALGRVAFQGLTVVQMWRGIG
jgi:hypothetical protein